MRPQDVHLFVFDSLSDWEAGYAIAGTIAGINNPHFQRKSGKALELHHIRLAGALSGECND